MPEGINAYALSLELSLKDQATEALRGFVNLANQAETQISNVQKKLDAIGSSSEGLSTQLGKASSQIAAMAKEKMTAATKGIKFSENEQKLQQDMAKDSMQNIDTRDKSEKAYRKATTDFMAKQLKQMKEEKKHIKLDAKSDKDQIKFESVKFGLLGKIMGLVKRRTSQTQATTKAQQRQVGLLDKMREKFGRISQLASKIKSGVSGLFTGIGLGDIAKAGSLMGLFAMGVTDAAQRAEKFHTVNFRVVGSMEQLNDEIIQLGRQNLPVTMERITETTIALREMGATRSVIDGLRVSTASFTRASGTAADAIAKQNVRLTALSGNTEYAKTQMAFMLEAQKNLNLTGKEVEAVMRNIGDSAFFLGTSGSNMMQQYQRSLLGIAGSAKELGVNVVDASQKAENLQDPLQVAAFIGQRAMGMNIEQLRKATISQAKHYNERIKRLRQEGKLTEASILKREALFRLQQAGLGGTMKDLAVLANMSADTQEDITKAFAKAGKEPEKQVEKAARSGEGLIQKQKLVMDGFKAAIQDMLKPVRNAFKELFDYIINNGLPIFLALGSVAVATGGIIIGALALVIGIIGGVVGGMVGLGGAIVSLGAMVVTVFGSVILGAVKMFGGMILRLTTRAIPALIAKLGGAKVAAALLGKGLLLVGAAVVGWKIGRAIDELTGFGDSLDRVNKGTGTWWDYAKTMSTPIGWIARGLNVATKSWRDYERAQFKATLQGKETAEWMKGSELAKRIKKLTKARAEATDPKEWKRLHKKIQALKAEEDAAWKKSAKYKATMAKVQKEKVVAEQKKASEEQIKATTKSAEEGVSKTDELWTKIEELTKKTAKMYEEHEIGEKLSAGWDTFKDKAGPALKAAGKKMAGFAKEYGPKVSKLLSEAMTKATGKLSEFKKELSKLDLARILKHLPEDLGDKLKKVFSMAGEGLASKMPKKQTGQQIAVEAGIEKRQAEIQKQAKPQPESDIAKMSLGKALLSRRGPTIEKPIPEAEPLVTTKDTVNVKPDTEMKDQFQQQNETIAALREAVEKGGETPTELERIVQVLESYLPEIAQGRDSGLTSAANQWQPS